MTYSLYIKAGTLVQGQHGMIKLSGDVAVTGATREDDGSFLYQIGSRPYYCSAGCCEFEEDREYIYRHKDGLVWIGA